MICVILKIALHPRMMRGCTGFIAGGWQQNPTPGYRIYSRLGSQAMPLHTTQIQLQERTAAHNSGGDEDEEENDDDEVLVDNLVDLTSPKFKNIEVREIQSMEEAGRLVLKPFFQRGFKWTQPQSSLYIESILRGYPCLPEVTLLETEDEDGETQYATFDGQQRLTSIVSYIRNVRADHWKATKTQKDNNVDAVFALERLPLLKHLEGKKFKDLEKRDQNKIKNFDVRCAIIPSCWDMADYINFFARIQGGGTPMSDHELRRAISRGPFTDLLDKLAQQAEVVDALSGSNLKPDEIQELLLRYYALSSYGIAEYGKPSHPQQGLQTMKAKNEEMQKWSAAESRTKHDSLVRPLVDALKLLLFVFDKEELFRRPQPLLKKNKVQSPSKVWVGTGTNRAIWDCLVFSFAILEPKEHAGVRKNADELRDALFDLFQTHPVFTDSINKAGTSARISVVGGKLREILLSNAKDLENAQVPAQTRKDLITEALKAKALCPLCSRQLSPFEAHLHIDHIQPRSKGGNNHLSNLQVVHKTCNLLKSNKMPK